MTITLCYRNGDTCMLDAPYGMKHPKDQSKPYKAILDKETWDKEFVRNKVAMVLDPRDKEGVTWLG